MSLEWVGRVPQIDLRDLIKTAIGIETEGYTHQLYFDYPKTGGFESLPKAVAAKIAKKITTGFRVTSVKRIEGGYAVISSKGEERHYKQLVCTLPLTTLFAALEDVPKEINDAAHALRFNSLRVALIGVKATNLPEYTALYVPDPKSLYHRVCYNQVFSPDMVPAGCNSVSTEITVPPGGDLDSWSDEKVLDRVVDDLHRDKIIDKSTVCFRMVRREKFAYVVYDHGYSDRVKKIRQFTDSRDIHLAGRFAEYQYVNTDACVRRALDLSRQLRAGDIAEEARIAKTW
jgi:protoporphyrinogen oxidase